MIKVNVKFPSLKRKLEGSWMKNRTTNLVDGVANKCLWNIQEYGFGSAGGNTPSGGSPIWQGKIWEKGHYRGYLSESHYIKKNGYNNAQIVTSADFVWGVIEGYSTNWFDSDMNPVIFPENRYHKRAVDNMYKDNTIGTIWNNIMDK